MNEIYCPTAARNEVLLLLSWLTVVLVLFSRRSVGPGDQKREDDS